MIYLDAEKLVEYRTIFAFDDVEIPVLETYVESLIAIAHAIYKRAYGSIAGLLQG